MNIIPTLTAAVVLSLHAISLAQTAKPDAFEQGMREAFVDYGKGDHEAVTAKLRELIKMIEEKDADAIGQLLPLSIGDWKGESVKQEELGFLGGGMATSRNYVSGDDTISVKVIKDAPVIAQLIPLLANEDLVRLSNRKTHRISGETAIMEGESKLQIVLDQRILLEITGTEGVRERDLLFAARSLNLNILAKMK